MGVIYLAMNWVIVSNLLCLVNARSMFLDKQSANLLIRTRRDAFFEVQLTAAYEEDAEKWENYFGEEVFGAGLINPRENINQKTLRLYRLLYFRNCSKCKLKFIDWIWNYSFMDGIQRNKKFKR